MTSPDAVRARAALLPQGERWGGCARCIAPSGSSELSSTKPQIVDLANVLLVSDEWVRLVDVLGERCLGAQPRTRCVRDNEKLRRHFCDRAQVLDCSP